MAKSKIAVLTDEEGRELRRLSALSRTASQIEWDKYPGMNEFHKVAEHHLAYRDYEVQLLREYLSPDDVDAYEYIYIDTDTDVIYGEDY